MANFAVGINVSFIIMLAFHLFSGEYISQSLVEHFSDSRKYRQDLVSSNNKIGCSIWFSILEFINQNRIQCKCPSY